LRLALAPHRHGLCHIQNKTRTHYARKKIKSARRIR
jgi:hypothetical protein